MSPVPTAKFTPTHEQLTASNPAQSVWVSASAGAGKTHVLVDRVIRLLLSGAAPDSILCITYTKAAASEMAGRLFARLGEWTGLSDSALEVTLNNLGEDGKNSKIRARARQLFTLALETPGGLKIQTIHAFCERLLHLFPVEAGLSPGFRVMDERTSQELQTRALRDVMRGAEAGDDAGLALAFAALTARLNGEQFEYLIKQFVTELHRLGAAAPDATTYAQALRQALGIAEDETPEKIRLRLNVIDRAAYVHHAAALKPFGPHRRRDHAELLAAIARAENPEPELLAFYLTANGEKPRADFMSVKAIAAAPDTQAFLDQEKERIFSLFTLFNTLQVIGTSMFAYALAQATLARVEAEKHRLGLYGFDDLIARTAALLTSSAAKEWVRFKLDPGISHVLLDEAQDTSPAQWQIIRALADEFSSGEEKPQSRTLFVVGDPKQSIYSFQGADAAGFAAVRNEFIQNGAVQSVDLTTSYRSTQDLLKAVDDVFHPSKLRAMGISAEGEYKHIANRKNAPGRVELWPLLEDDDDAEEGDAWQEPVDKPPQSAPRRKLAAKLAATLKVWLQPGHPRRLLSTGQPLRAEDILILFQTRGGSLFRMVLAELRKAGVPVAGADRLNLLRSLIVQDLLMLLHWLLLPEDDHALAVILKSPLVPYPLDDDALVPLCHGRQPGTLLARLEGENAIWLKSLLARRTEPFALLSHILTQFRQAVMARLGTEALEASDAMLNMVMDYEQQHGTSLFGFVQWFAATETTLKREMEKGSGEVRLMTVHGAKGLEAPVVFIVDAATVPGGGKSLPAVIKSPLLPSGLQLPVWLVSGYGAFTEALNAWPDDQRQAAQRERDRLLYVAMTRAADELYVTGVKPKRGHPPDGCWWNTLTAALGEPQAGQHLRLPAGPDAEHVASAAQAHAQGVALPSWVSPAPLERLLSATRAVTSRGQGEPVGYDAKAARRGRAIHRLMEELAAVEPDTRAATARKWAARLEVAELEALDLAEALNAQALVPFLGPDSAGEVDVIGELASGAPVSGRIDRLAIRSKGIWLLDYKTDRFVPESILSNHAYARQMASYVALLRQAHPGRPVTAALYWTGPKRLEILAESLLAAALQESEPAAS